MREIGAALVISCPALPPWAVGRKVGGKIRESLVGPMAGDQASNVIPTATLATVAGNLQDLQAVGNLGKG